MRPRTMVALNVAGTAALISVFFWFGRDHSPLMLLRCAACHGGRRREADLDLRTKAGMLKGGKSGPAAIAGKPEESLLIRRIHAVMTSSAEALPERRELVAQYWLLYSLSGSADDFDSMVDPTHRLCALRVYLKDDRTELARDLISRVETRLASEMPPCATSRSPLNTKASRPLASKTFVSSGRPAPGQMIASGHSLRACSRKRSLS